jgi:putative ABC transport system substrate-binding protein
MLGALATTLPLAAQQRPWRIGMLSLINPGAYWKYFQEALRDFGYANAALVIRSAEGNEQKLHELAGELVRERVDIIVCYQTPSVVAARKATNTIPIVMAPAGDPVASGLVTSLARPGANVTGVSGSTTDLAVKTLELVKDVRPQARRVGVLANATDAFTKTFVGNLEDAGRRLRIELRVAMVRSENELDAVFAEWVKSKVEAVIVQPSLPRRRPIELALKYRLPSMAPAAPFADAGGLMSYSNSTKEIGRKAAVFVDKILKGAKPAELPVEQPTVFELIVNLRTAKALGITFPPSVVARADRVVE